MSLSLPDGSSLNIARIPIAAADDWSLLEERLSSVFMHHVTAVNTGLRTKRVTKAMDATSGESSLSPDSPTSPPGLGLTMNSIKHYTIGTVILIVVK